MIIEKLTSKYINQVVELETKLLNTTLGYEMLENEMNSSTSIILIARINDTVIGYISGYNIYPELEILNFCVDESYQRKGIGQKLFDSITSMSKANKIFLDVKSTNIKGKSFYLKNGFKQISIRSHYYSDGSDDLVMMKEII